MTTRTELLQEEYLRREGNKPGKFRYFWPDGTELTDAGEIERIDQLAVPPAYHDVFVSPDADADLQAFGRDEAGRLQYRYHPDFLQASALRKWERLARFAGHLPQLRELTTSDLRASGLPPRKVMALMTRLLYVAHFRVGTPEYARANRTFGLTTLRKRHVQVDGNTVEFVYRGKHGIQQHKAVTDRTVAGNIERLLELPGWELFKAETEDGVQRIHAADLNGYIREVMGPFTAKDFRTWGGTLHAAEYLAHEGVHDDEREARRAVVACVKDVAADLGNTPAVVRQHYICPVIFDRYFDGKILDDYEPRESRRRASGEAGLSRSEAALKRMLESEDFGRAGRKKKKRK